MSGRIEVARCRYCGHRISRLQHPDEGWRHDWTNADTREHRPAPQPGTVRDLLSR